MQKNILIGVDGGGTKCKVRIETQAGELLGESRSGPGNICTSADEAWHNILDGVNSVLGPLGIKLDNPNYNFYIGCGLAGTEFPPAIEKFLSHPHPFGEKLLLKSDAYAACLGAHDGADGAIVIIGTGVIGMRVEGDDIIAVGGWGFPQDDEGGGAWLGLEAVRLAFRAYDGRQKYTPMLEAIWQKFDNDLNTFLSWMSNARPETFGQIAPIVIEYVEKEDRLALRLMKKAAKEIDLLIGTIEQRAGMGAKLLPYSLFGGVAPFVQPRLHPMIQNRLVERKFDATYGSILMLKKEFGL
ncbi:MAG: hypothetical protein JXR42_02040 [Gammaproteobacteria bacterium]|nr:hypothetical protein [Gammaproteobacteria bacterium]